MKPWVGAVAVAAAILAAPSVALAGEDDPAQLQFKLPSEEAVHDFERPRAQHGPRRHPQPRWHRCHQRVGHRRAGAAGPRGARLRRRRHDPQQVRDRPHPRGAQHDAHEAQGRQASAARERRGQEGQERSLPGTSGPSARTTWENNVGRYLSIEANVDGAAFDGQRRLHRPDASSRSGIDAAGNRARRRQPRRVSTTPTSARTTTSTTTRDRPVGNKGDGGPVPAIGQGRVARTATSTRSPSASGSPRIRPSRRRPLSRLRHALQRLARGVQEDA